MQVNNVYIGRTTEGSRIFADVELRTRKYDTPRETTAHGEVSEVIEFSASGLEVEFRAQNAYSAGQMLEELLKIDRPAKGLTMGDVMELHGYWVRWHLNAMKAGCDHLPKGSELGRGTVCPETGYKYGHKWLIEPIPADVQESMERLIWKLSKLPERYNGN